MLRDFLKQAQADEPVFVTDVREAFSKEGTRPFHLHVHTYDGNVRRFAMPLPGAETAEEKEFLAAYVHARISNILTSLGAVTIEVYFDPSDAWCASLAEGLDEVFQSKLPKSRRRGFGKYMNVNERVLHFLTGGEKRFSFALKDAGQEPDVAEAPPVNWDTPVFASLPEKARDKMLLGIDIGGTDIKLAASVKGTLAVCKEFDWFPAAFALAEQFIEPVVLLVRLMRAAASLTLTGREEEIDRRALAKDASVEEMEEGVRRMEEALGGAPVNFDAIGLSFPDVVIDNMIVGGETFKTKGMRENTQLDYEQQFGKISVMADILKEYVTKNGAVLNTNDGNMSAFTTAVELAAVGADVSKGFFAHTLGTELGTGWVRPDGSIPKVPLEVYNSIIDLGSYAQRQYPSADVRSINNFNTDLPGTLQKYTSQYGVFRMAAKYLPEREPEVLEEAFAKGIFVWQGDTLVVPTEPKDMRKPALEFFMAKAADGSSAVCREIFRQVGTCLAVTWQETESILCPETKDRSLYGRLIKVPECFELINEGAQARVPSLKHYAADSSLANTSLMKQLDAHPDYTVAQFAQAVGGLFFGCSGL